VHQHQEVILMSHQEVQAQTKEVHLKVEILEEEVEILEEDNLFKYKL
jgi:hypothetical protein